MKDEGKTSQKLIFFSSCILQLSYQYYWINKAIYFDKDCITLFHHLNLVIVDCLFRWDFHNYGLILVGLNSPTWELYIFLKVRHLKSFSQTVKEGFCRWHLLSFTSTCWAKFACMVWTIIYADHQSTFLIGQGRY